MTDLQRVKGIVSPIAEKYGVSRMSLFGSRARGDVPALAEAVRHILGPEP